MPKKPNPEILPSDEILELRKTIQPGLYRIARDVENPCPDLRTRRSFWLSATFEAGRYLVVESRTEHLGDDPNLPLIERTVITRPGSSYSGERQLRARQLGADPKLFNYGERTDKRDERDLRIEALLPALEHVEPSTISQLFTASRTEERSAGFSILAFLVATEQLSLAQISTALKAYNNRESSMFWDTLEAYDPERWSEL